MRGNPRFSLPAYAEKLIKFFFLISRVKVCVCSVAQLCQNLCDPRGCRGLLGPWGFSRPEYWSWLPCPPPGDLPNPGIEPSSLALQVNSLPSESPGKPKKTGMGHLSLSPGDLPDPVIEPGSPALQVDSLPAELPRKPTVSACVMLIFSPTGLYSFSNTVMLSYLFICLFMYQYWARNR